MMPAPVVLLLLKTTLVLVAALGITRVLQRASAGTRHLVWLATLGALLLVPVVAVWSPLRLAVLPAVPSSVSTPSTREALPENTTFAAAPTPGVASTVAPTAPASPDASDATHAPSISLRDRLHLGDVVGAALALWAIVALVIGASLAAAWLSARRIVLRARPLDGADWLDPLYEIADRLDLSEPPRLLRSEDAKMPFACGVAQPTIVLPAESDGWSLDRRRAVLLHELAHVRRRDLAGHTLARVLCAVYWFHPLVWTAARRLRAESEHACDDLALSCGARPADYAEHLLDIVTSVRRDATPIVALAMARRSEFEGRMLAILDPERVRATPSRRQAASLVGVLALLAVLVGAAVPAPAAEVRGQTAVATRDEQPPRERRAMPSPAPRPAPMPMVVARPQPSPDASALHQYDDDPRDTSVQDSDPIDHARGDRLAGLRELIARHDVTPQSAATDERVELLARVLRGDSSASLRRIAAWGLAEHAEQPTAAAALAAAVRGDASATVREMAAWALADAEREPAARDALAGALRRDDDVRVRATAAWALGSLGDRQAADALVAALGDASADVRSRAVWALGNVEPREAPRALVAMLGDREPRVRELTAWALYEIEDPAAIPALQAAMRTERDTDLQLAYVRAMAVLGEQSVDALRPLLESSDARIKSVAVRALASGRASGPWPWPWPQPRPYP